jgi:hypothetical protein
MRRKYSFLLTVFPTEDQQPALHGRLEYISNGISYTFNNLAELQKIIESSITAGPSAEKPQLCQPGSSYPTGAETYPGHCEEENFTPDRTEPDTSFSM